MKNELTKMMIELDSIKVVLDGAIKSKEKESRSKGILSNPDNTKRYYDLRDEILELTRASVGVENAIKALEEMLK